MPAAAQGPERRAKPPRTSFSATPCAPHELNHEEQRPALRSLDHRGPRFAAPAAHAAKRTARSPLGQMWPSRRTFWQHLHASPPLARSPLACGGTRQRGGAARTPARVRGLHLRPAHRGGGTVPTCFIGIRVSLAKLLGIGCGRRDRRLRPEKSLCPEDHMPPPFRLRL